MSPHFLVFIIDMPSTRGYIEQQSHKGGLPMKKIKITAELSPAEEGGYVVYCPELDVTTEGDTVEDAIYMLKDAAAGYIEVVGIENIPHFAKAHRTHQLELVING